MSDDRANPEHHRSEFLRACRIAQQLGDRLSPVIGPLDASGALISTATNLLVNHFGTRLTADYYRDLAAELEAEEQTKLQ